MGAGQQGASGRGREDGGFRFVRRRSGTEWRGADATGWDGLAKKSALAA